MADNVHFSLPRSEARRFVWTDELGLVHRWLLKPYSRALGDVVQKLFHRLTRLHGDIADLAGRSDALAEAAGLTVDMMDVRGLSESDFRARYVDGLSDELRKTGELLAELKGAVDRSQKTKLRIFRQIVAGVVETAAGGEETTVDFVPARHLANMPDEWEAALLTGVVARWKNDQTIGGYRYTADSLLVWLAREADRVLVALPAESRAVLAEILADPDQRAQLLGEFFRPLEEARAGNRESRRSARAASEKKSAS